MQVDGIVSLARAMQETADGRQGQQEVTLSLIQDRII